MWVWGHYFMHKVCIQGLAGSSAPRAWIQEKQRGFQGEGSDTRHVQCCHPALVHLTLHSPRVALGFGCTWSRQLLCTAGCGAGAVWAPLKVTPSVLSWVSGQRLPWCGGHTWGLQNHPKTTTTTKKQHQKNPKQKPQKNSVPSSNSLAI